MSNPEDIILRTMMLDFDSEVLPDTDEDFDAWLDRAVPTSARDMVADAPAGEMVPLLRKAAELEGPTYERIVHESNVGWEHPDSGPELTQILTRLADEIETL